MEIKNIYAVYFSPAESTGTIVRAAAEEAAALLEKEYGREVPVSEIDFTLPAAREKIGKKVFAADDLVFFGTPTYAGRIPNKALPFVEELFEGSGTPLCALATFGNRSYDNVLRELTTVAKKNGFIPLGAGAFVARHVFSGIMAAGRPDAGDMDLVSKLAHGVAEKILSCGSSGADEALKPLDLGEPGPYYTPLGEDGQPVKFLKAKPKTDTEKCGQCGLCAEKCPLGSIDKDDVTSVIGICIKCHSCVRRCPAKAKYFDDEQMMSHLRMLEANYAERRAESEIIL